MAMPRAGCRAGGNQPRCCGFPAVSTRRDVPGKENSHGEGSERSQELRAPARSHQERCLDTARGGSRAAPREGHSHPAIRPPTQHRGCSRHRLTPTVHPLWSRCWLVRIELKPKAVPTFSGKGAANRIYCSSLWFYRPLEILLSDLAEIRRQIPVINDGGGGGTP